jgi:DNA adenine methylase
MPEANSPLRYPGGKAVLSDFLAAAIDENEISDCVYAEPFAGGAGAAINLLLAGKVDRVLLNDADRCLWSFWQAILNQTEAFIALVKKTPVTVAEWRRQRAIYTQRPRRILELGFAAFFLNRCNRSGILTNGGVIGGLDQMGKWKIDARYNRDELIRRIERIAAHQEKIKAFNLDAIDFLRTHVLHSPDRARYLVYLDPPYFVKGSQLYLNYYEPKDHAVLARFLARLRGIRWITTYDDTPEIRKLYSWRPIIDFNLRYSAHSPKSGNEIMFASSRLRLPVAELQRDIA